jgi:uncharacterized protein
VQLRAADLVFSPSHLRDFLECEHLAVLDLGVLRGELTRPADDDPTAELIRRKGEAHEQSYLERLRAEGRRIVEVDRGHRDWDRAARETAQALRDPEVDVVYQGVFVDDGWRGVADFVERQPDGSWEVADTKLARHSKPYFLLQLAFYSEAVERIQGRPPERMHVVLGTNERESFRVADFAAYFRRARRRFLGFVADAGETYPHPVEHCRVCAWRDECARRRVEDDHLSLVASMRRSWIATLAGAGITTLAGLAAAQEEAVEGLRPEILERIRDQAAMQHRARLDGVHAWKLLPAEPGRGLSLLPEPSEGDVFFDIEGDPFYEPARGLEYLHGVVHNGTFRAFWARSGDEERRAFEELVDFLTERLRRHPDMHVYHYAHYEPTALKRLMGHYGTREDEVDELLRREVFVDLYRVVAQSLRISHPRYGLKQVETFFMPPRTEDVSAGDDSIVVFERWLETGDEALLESIERYNEFDCRATLALRDWLLERRAEAGVTHWKEPRPRREQAPERAEAIAERERLRQQLVAGADEGDERWLAGQLLEYHRREARPVWWHYFRRLDATEEELRDWDREAIGGLVPTGEPQLPVKKSLVHTLAFPAQQHKLGPGEAVDPATEKGEAIVAIDDERGLLRLKRGPKRQDDPLPRSLIPPGAWDTRAQREALARLAQALLAGGDRYGALRDILRREPHPRPVQTVDLDEQKRLVLALEEGHLFFQGPPGSGKTWTGARLIVHLLRERRRVGITAPSHKAIHNLLAEVERVATEERTPFRGLKKGDDEESTYAGPYVETSNDIADFRDPDVRLVAGTAWLHAREELDGTLDHLFVDEAGQVSLADALAVGTAARNLVLLGDPLQLAQVSQGVHPGGTGASVLEHLLGGHATVPPDRGVFLERTWRMHPDVCAFVSEVVYDGRLEPAPGRERQRIEGVGAGLRHVPVEHEGRSQSSPEEAAVVAAQAAALIGRFYTNAKGQTRRLGPDDVLVVTPYNAQVRCLRAALPDGVRVGTVD